MSHDKRSNLMPNIPTLDESGLKGFDRLGWYGLMTKAGVPRDTIMKVHSAVVNATNTAEIKSVLQKQGLEPATNTPEEFAAFIRKELDINAKLVKAAGIKTE
jgi:tripartite-type tricarboxylate transporter receptor subunit TctC